MRKFIIFLALYFSCTYLINAQTGTLEGRVINANVGKPIPGFQVMIPKANMSTKTDSLGRYKFKNVPADTYKLKLTRRGYGDHTVKNVVVEAGEVTTKNISLTKAVKIEKEQRSIAQDRAVLRRPQFQKGKHEGFNDPDYPTNRDFNREAYDRLEANPFRRTKGHPLSTFSIDVDRASYANTRRFINNEELPPKDAVRIEELINYFDYDYPEPSGRDPFSVYSETAKCPWKKDHKLLHIGLKGQAIPKSAIPPSNLVFLVDVSGSMNSPDKLPLVKTALRLLTEQLREKDQITLVVYAGSSGMALPPTSGDQKDQIKQAIGDLEAGGATAGSKGIKLAYEKAQENFIENGNNRVILATDGDFNIGVTSDGALTRLIEKKRENGVFLSVLGFGAGNYQGSKMEKLSNKGNGNYSYVDSRLEAKKTLVSEFGGTMNTIAKDVKIQVEFNPAKVRAYRLIGYVNRQLDKEEFRDDSTDAGELGAGHSVTALYQLVPVGKAFDEASSSIPELKYQEQEVKKIALESNELGTLKLRYKEPNGNKSKLMEYPIKPKPNKDISSDFHWAAAVAMFGMHLRESPYKGITDYSLIQETAEKGQGSDEEGYRQGFLEMVEKARKLEESRY